MRRMNCERIEYDKPFSGDYKETAHNIGFETARLHKALEKFRNPANVYESDFMGELNGSLSEIKANNIDFPRDIFTNDYTDGAFIARWAEFFRSFLFGYNSENMLSAGEINSIYKMCVALQITFVSFYLWLEGKRELIPRRIELAKWLYENETILSNLF